MDWVRFLDENNVPYVTRGPNTKRGEVSIHCPMCAEEDPSEHLGINPQTGYWGCLRDASHRGKSARTLLKAILHCSSQQAGLIIKQYSHSDPDGLDAALVALDEVTSKEDAFKQARQQLQESTLADFSKIRPRGLTKRFFTYLVNRGYDNPQELIAHYDLRCALTGRYKDRVIIPVRQNGELLGWTSRAIATPKLAPRYLMSSEDVKATVFNYDSIKHGGERLFIVEGPFDAIRIDNYGLTEKAAVVIKATCTFGTSATIGQMALLRSLVKRFEDAWVLFDRGAEAQANNLAEWVGANVAYLPGNVGDPDGLGTHHLFYMTGPTFSGFYDLSHWLHLSTRIGGINRQKSSYWSTKKGSNKP
jgi:hypothetical protein